MPSLPPAEPYGAAEALAEHRACVDYHTALVNSRFTIAGLYVAAMGFIAGAVFKEDMASHFQAAASFLACWLTVCLWILELRSRALFTNIAHRGIEIERNHWKLDGANAMSGFFSRQLKVLPSPTSNHVTSPDRPSLGGWPRKPLPERLSRYISHSVGLDLLYAGGLIFWLASTGIAIFYWMNNC